MKIISRAEGEGAVDVFTKQWIHFKKIVKLSLQVCLSKSLEKIFRNKQYSKIKKKTF